MSESGGPPEDGSPADDASGQERLLAEALRAQAGSASDADRAGEEQGSSPDETGHGTDPVVPSGFGLLSGAEAGSLERERAALDARHPSRTHTAEATPGARYAAGPPGRWVLLLAVLLGIAAGSVAGLLTLL